MAVEDISVKTEPAAATSNEEKPDKVKSAGSGVYGHPSDLKDQRQGDGGDATGGKEDERDVNQKTTEGKVSAQAESEAANPQNNRKRKKISLVQSFQGKRWRDLYADLIRQETDRDSRGLDISNRKNSINNATRRAEQSSGGDDIVFSPKPLLEPLALVQCSDCKRRVKMNAFANHSARCKRLRSNSSTQSHRVIVDYQLGIPRGTKFSRGSISLRPDRENSAQYSRWKGERINDLQDMVLRPHSLPAAVDPLFITEPEEKAPLAHLFQKQTPKPAAPAASTASTTSATHISASKPKKADIRKDSKSKKSTKPSTSSKPSKDSKSKKADARNTKKESKEKRPKKAKTDNKKRSTKRSNTKKSTKGRKMKLDDDLDSVSMKFKRGSSLSSVSSSNSLPVGSPSLSNLGNSKSRKRKGSSKSSTNSNSTNALAALGLRFNIPGLSSGITGIPRVPMPNSMLNSGSNSGSKRGNSRSIPAVPKV